MLNDHEFMLLMDELATPGKGRQLIAKVRNEAPVRDVKSTGKNIITFVASQKMESPGQRRWSVTEADSTKLGRQWPYLRLP